MCKTGKVAQSVLTICLQNSDGISTVCSILVSVPDEKYEVEELLLAGNSFLLSGKGKRILGPGSLENPALIHAYPTPACEGHPESLSVLQLLSSLEASQICDFMFFSFGPYRAYDNLLSFMYSDCFTVIAL